MVTKHRLSRARAIASLGRLRDECSQVLLERIDECIRLIAAGEHREAREIFEHIDRLRTELKQLESLARRTRRS